MKKAILLPILFVFILSAFSTGMSTKVHAEFHSNRTGPSLVKRQISQDFIPINLKIASIGDSLTKGVGDSTERGGYIPFLKTSLENTKGIKKIEIVNLGIKGLKSSDLIVQLRKRSVQNELKSSNMVILTIGGNDIMKVVKGNISNLQKSDFTLARDKFESNLYSIIDLIRKSHPRIPIILVSLYNPFFIWFSDVKELEEILTDWNMVGNQVIDTYDNTYFVSIDDLFKVPNRQLLSSDNFHPNDRGYQLVSRRIYETITEKTIEDYSRDIYMVRKEEK
ncbi:SGNH/GDSL hydrolase family protein [Pseudoneobacillus sp. C159]